MTEVDIDILVEKYYRAGEMNEPGVRHRSCPIAWKTLMVRCQQQPARWKCGVANCGSVLKSSGIYNIRRHLKTHVVDEQCVDL